jgi:archaellum component FlaC
MGCAQQIVSDVEGLKRRVEELEKFAEFITSQLVPEEEVVEDQLEAFHQRFVSKLKGGA